MTDFLVSYSGGVVEIVRAETFDLCDGYIHFFAGGKTVAIIAERVWFSVQELNHG